jgi:hypothetical protein
VSDVAVSVPTASKLLPSDATQAKLTDGAAEPVVQPAFSREEITRFNRENPEIADITRQLFQERSFLDLRRSDQQAVRELMLELMQQVRPPTSLDRKQKPRNLGASRQDSGLTLRAKQILDFWSVRYKKLFFEPQPLRWAADLDHIDLVRLETVLYGLERSNNPASLSRSKMKVTEEHHLGWKLFDGTECRLFYKMKPAIVCIGLICKKSDMNKHR